MLPIYAAMVGMLATSAGMQRPPLTTAEVALCYARDQQLMGYASNISASREALKTIDGGGNLSSDSRAIALVARINVLVDVYNATATSFNNDCRGRATSTETLSTVCDASHFGRPPPVSAYCDSFGGGQPKSDEAEDDVSGFWVSNHPGVPPAPQRDTDDIQRRDHLWPTIDRDLL